MSAPFDIPKMFELLYQACVRAQEKGKFNLREASVIQVAADYFKKGVKTDDINNDPSAFQVLVSALELAQLRGGVFSLEEASNLYNDFLRLAEWAKTLEPVAAATESTSSPAVSKGKERASM